VGSTICERALAIHEELLGPEHPESARSVEDLAVLLAKSRTIVTP
jgi:hypothetical protein